MPRTEVRALPWPRVRAWLALADALAVAIGLVLGYELRFGVRQPFMAEVTPTPLWLLPGFWLVWLLVIACNGLYSRRNTVSGIGEYRRLLTSSVWVLVFVVLASYVRTHPYVSRGFLVISALTTLLALGVGRFIVRRVIYRFAESGRCLDRAVVIGTNQQAIAVARQLADSPAASCEVVGFLSDYLPVGAAVANAGRVLGEPLQLSSIAADQRISRAFVVESGLSWESLRGMVQEMHRSSTVDISLVPGLFDLHATSMAPHQIGPVLTLAPHPARIVGTDAVVKRALDLALGTAVLLFALPVSGLVAVLARLSGERTVLVAERFVDGRGEFTMRRFDRPRWAVDLHLARLINVPLVLGGRMSVLGPRPIPAQKALDYGEALTLLQSAKPGFIGPWWLAGIQRPAELNEELAYDLYYLRNYSIWFDLHMLIQAARGLRGSDINIRGYSKEVAPDRAPTEAPS